MRWGFGGGKPPPKFLLFAQQDDFVALLGEKNSSWRALALQTSHLDADCVSLVK
jgi:hypothetical protein